MRYLLMSLVIHAVLFAAAATAFAKPKPKSARRPPPIDVVADTQDKRIPPPGYKGTNEGAQGRKNATEDAARAAEGASPDFRRF